MRLRLVGMGAVIMVAVVTPVLLAPAPATAQAPLPAPTITGFIQTGWHARLTDAPYPGFSTVVPPSAAVNHGFFMNNARLYVSGAVGEAFGYLVQTELAGGVASVLSAKIMWGINDSWTLHAGQMLKPFGRDRTRAKHGLLSLDRSMASLLLVNGQRYGSWDVGVLATYRPDGGLYAQLGMFNGQPVGATMDVDTGKNLVGRMVLPLGDFELGINASFLHVSTRPGNERSQQAFGLDGLYEAGPMTLEFEAMMADRWVGTTPALQANSLNLTIAYELGAFLGSRSSQLVFRLEQYDPDTSADRDHMLMLVPSLNLSVSEVSRFQIGLVHQNPSASGADSGNSLVALWQVDFF